ncbi:acyl-CoA/acyl-ACP dehydrogenase [Mycolicibacillus parakoreensis]|uniref:Acyl-CoA/acyl-ACP dehydrogenase n=1 Tax=Mycolicibacillus parakoreensis TaxID=1069221 RepID=A0ABY3U0P2_9MYCO|nr:acyl-CoA dehydrogenase family protein [Mycolicibacillus parakoreensis]MCV7316956.1 acyl-CoA/acyl-ACP dehydrogenase [Mycolicibacillus parakoreensis]ULN51301.1 acyl-CoA/acyl-ACP dehydrogenase [Mycolicibacillus parakoreensis]
MTTTEFAAFHDDLRAVAGDVLAREPVVDWARLVDTGWAGLEVPEEFGGAGATFAETAVICEELGRAAATAQYLGSAVLAVGALTALPAGAVRDRLLTAIAAGELRVTAVIGQGSAFRLTADRRLSGSAEFVPDAEGADRFLVLATDVSGTEVVVDVAGLAVTAQPVLDPTRTVATVAADGIEVDASAVLRFEPGGAQTVRNRAALAVACDSLGLAEAMLARTVTYARARTQFGRPIGSFQAVKHACADMLVTISAARALVGTGVETLVADRAEDVTAAVAMAKSYTGAAAVEVVGKALQLHGGIGYTWESGIHAYLKRATFNRSLFGSPAAHRQYLAHRYQ